MAIPSGCNNSCTFCIVPSCGEVEVSPIGDILGEVRGLARGGVGEVTLLGQNVNSYGRDISRTAEDRFADLLRLDEIPGLRRMRFTSPHPKDFVAGGPGDGRIECVCEHLHLPMQSGSDRVLKAMKRSYSREKYLSKVAIREG